MTLHFAGFSGLGPERRYLHGRLPEPEVGLSPAPLLPPPPAGTPPPSTPTATTPAAPGCSLPGDHCSVGSRWIHTNHRTKKQNNKQTHKQTNHKINGAIGNSLMERQPKIGGYLDGSAYSDLSFKWIPLGIMGLIQDMKMLPATRIFLFFFEIF